MKAKLPWIATLCVFTSGVVFAETPLSTAFTYQGQLKSGGSPASGSFTMVFKLFDASGAGNQVGPTLTFDGAGGNPPQVAVAGGLFTVQLDFGSVFSGNKRWLAITVSGTTLSPRQELTAAPNALFALNAGLLNGLSSSAFLQSVPFPLFLTGTANYVIEGENNSSTNFTAGVRGDSASAPGATYGVYGTNTSTGGVGVVGLATATTGNTTGVAGQSDSSAGTGVRGYAGAGSGTTYGVDGQSTSTSGTGVRGYANAVSGTTYGVYGQNNSTSGCAVYGIALAASGDARGVYGISQSTSGLGTVGYATATTGTNYGIYGQSDSPSGYGGYFNGRGYFSGNVGIGTIEPTTSLDVRGVVTIDVGGDAALMTGTGFAELNRYLSLYNSVQSASASGLKAGGVLVSDNYAYANPGKNDLVVKGRIGVGTAAPSQALHVVGNICATGSIGVCSDARFKEHVVPMAEAMSIVEKLRPVHFDWKREQFPEHHFSRDRQIGLIAQEVQKVAPEAVQKGTDGYLAVDYGRLTPILIAAVKQQQETIQDLRTQSDRQLAQKDEQLARQQQRITDLEARFDRMEKTLASLTGPKGLDHQTPIVGDMP